MKQLLSSYWNMNNRTGIIYLVLVIGMTCLTIWGTADLNDWRNNFYTSLEAHNMAAFWPLMLHFSLVAAALVLLYAFITYVQQRLALDWRSNLTDYFESRWIKSRVAVDGDNPDQRIAEDVNKFCSGIISLSSTLLTQGIMLVIFAIILWNLSSGLFDIPGLLLYISLGYAILGTSIIGWIGYPLVNIEFETQKREADYRYGLAIDRVKTSEERDKTGHWLRYDSLVEILYVSFTRQKLVNFFVSGFNQIEVIIPFLVIAPFYFGSDLKLGWLMATAQAMSMVQNSVAYLVNNYAELARLKATVNRLTVFDKQLGE